MRTVPRPGRFLAQAVDVRGGRVGADATIAGFARTRGRLGLGPSATHTLRSWAKPMTTDFGWVDWVPSAPAWRTRNSDAYSSAFDALAGLQANAFGRRFLLVALDARPFHGEAPWGRLPRYPSAPRGSDGLCLSRIL
jgi:hypothetical protein